jgi:hypothetical protein
MLMQARDTEDKEEAAVEKRAAIVTPRLAFIT